MQRSFDDLGTPLAEVTFVVLDLETTGGSPQACEITEVGAVRVRGGELLGTYQTLVNPGVEIPPSITVLTGITTAMVVPAPSIGPVLESFVDFVGSGVIVGHNVRFDMGFLAAAMDRHGWPRFRNVVVDTCALARRLIREEVPNCRLHTLARYLGAGHRPTHRALDDALATTDVLHALLERAGTFGVLGLEDLVALPTVGAHPQLGKLTLTRRLPTTPGVYIFRDAGGRPLYVGKAVNLRRRVRSYFTGDERRKIGGLLRELATIDHIECTSELEASVVEVRKIQELTPRYNKVSKHWRGYRYVKLTLEEAWPRLSVVQSTRTGDGCLYLGPVGSTGTAKRIIDAIQTAIPLRRCAGPVRDRDGPCTAAQLGVATCPCSGTVNRDAYREIVDRVVRGLGAQPELLLEPLAVRLARLSAARRYEECADLRACTAALVRAIERQRRMDAIRLAGALEVSIGPAWAVIDAGMFRYGGGPGRAAVPLPLDSGACSGPPGTPIPRHLVDEVMTVAAWLDSRAAAVTVRHCEGGLGWPAQRLPSWEPRAPTRDRYPRALRDRGG